MNTGLRSVPLCRFRGIRVGAHWSTLVAMSVLPRTAPGHSAGVIGPEDVGWAAELARAVPLGHRKVGS